MVHLCLLILMIGLVIFRVCLAPLEVLERLARLETE